MLMQLSGMPRVNEKFFMTLFTYIEKESCSVSFLKQFLSTFYNTKFFFSFSRMSEIQSSYVRKNSEQFVIKCKNFIKAFPNKADKARLSAFYVRET